MRAGARRPWWAAALVAFVAVGGCGGGPPGGSEAPSGPSDGPLATSEATAHQTATPTASVSAAATAATEPTTAPAAAWSQLPPPGAAPAAREAHTWTVDPGAEIAYLFGGRDAGAVFDDLWAYDLALDTWSAVAPAGERPPARFGHNAAWVPDIGLVIFAGQAGTTFYNDLWAYDPATNAWRLLPAAGDVPVPRYGSCAAVGPDGRLWISHGFTQDQVRFSDTRAYDFAVGAWSDETPVGAVPVARCLHGCFWTGDGGRLVLYAGQTTDTPTLGDLWALTPETGGWTVQPEPATAPRNLYAFTRRADGVLVIGGLGPDGTYPTDTFLLDGGLEFVPLETAASPPGRQGSQLIDDPTGGRVLLFGGVNGDGALADLWELRLP